ncbi:Structural maintenance of chromosomes protein 6 [Cryptotrichosporon argae]
MSYYPQPYPTFTPPSVLDTIAAPAPVYMILIVGMVLFLATHAMQGLLPEDDRFFTAVPLLLQWGFGICLLALCTQMLGLLPGVPRLHLTYVHMAVAFLIFFLVWNQTVSDSTTGASPEPSAPSRSSSSSSSSKERPREEKQAKVKDEAGAAPSAWDNLRAHPSAFLTTRLNRPALWPFPMGFAGKERRELWWESVTPAHVGHFNRPEPEATKSAESADKEKKEAEAKAKEKEKEKEKAKEKEAAEAAAKEKAKSKEAEKEKEKARAEEEAKAKVKRKEDEARKAKEDEARKRAEDEARRVRAVQDRQARKLQRTKYLVMIVGISFLNRTLGFLLLLFFALQMVSQELNPPPAPAATSVSASASSSSRAGGSSRSRSSSGSGGTESAEEKEKLAKMQAMKEERAKAEAKVASSSSSASKDKLSSSSSGSKEAESSSSARPSSSSSSSSSAKPSSSSSSSSSSRDKASSSSSSSSGSKDKPISSDAVRQAAGTRTVTHPSGEKDGTGYPLTPPLGMHYIYTPARPDELDKPSFVPGTGVSHPLMTTTYWGYADDGEE